MWFCTFFYFYIDKILKKKRKNEKLQNFCRNKCKKYMYEASHNKSG